MIFDEQCFNFFFTGKVVTGVRFVKQRKQRTENVTTDRETYKQLPKKYYCFLCSADELLSLTDSLSRSSSS